MSLKGGHTDIEERCPSPKKEHPDAERQLAEVKQESRNTRKQEDPHGTDAGKRNPRQYPAGGQIKNTANHFISSFRHPLGLGCSKTVNSS